MTNRKRLILEMVRQCEPDRSKGGCMQKSEYKAPSLAVHLAALALLAMPAGATARSTGQAQEQKQQQAPAEGRDGPPAAQRAHRGCPPLGG